jgi:HPt (histidine-containing phosphotransfer) domain-containing protein
MRSIKNALANDIVSTPKNCCQAAGVRPTHLPAAEENLPRIQSTFARNPQIMKIIPEFVAGLPAQVRKMTDLLSRNEMNELQKVVHQLRGASGGYGFDDTTAPATQLEESIKAGKPVPQIAVETESLINLIRRFDGYDQARELAAA